MATAAAAGAYGGDYLRQFEKETEWYNEIFLSMVVPGDWWRGLPHPLRSWLRNCIGGYLLYFISGFLWCFVIYNWKRHAYIPKGSKLLLLLLLVANPIPTKSFAVDRQDDSDQAWDHPLDPSLEPHVRVTFNVAQGNYHDLISQIRDALEHGCKNNVDGRCVLPRQRYNRKPVKWLMVELLAAADEKIVLAVRPDNLYITGFTNKSRRWYCFSNVDLSLIPSACRLRFADSYGSLVGGYSALRRVRFGRDTTLQALHEIANYEPNSATDVGRADSATDVGRAVAVLAVTVCEGTRFELIYDKIHDGWKDGAVLGYTARYIVNWKKISCAVLISIQNNGVWRTSIEAQQLAYDLGIHDRRRALHVLYFLLWPTSCSQRITMLK